MSQGIIGIYNIKFITFCCVVELTKHFAFVCLGNIKTVKQKEDFSNDTLKHIWISIRPTANSNIYAPCIKGQYCLQ